MINRTIKQEIIDSLSLKEVTVVIGARQVGKTTILKEILINLDKVNESIRFLEQSNKMMPNNSEVLRNLGYAYTISGKYEK